MAECRNSTVLEEITPEERQWRLSQVYGLLIAVSRQKRAEQQRPNELAQVESNSSSISRE